MSLCYLAVPPLAFLSGINSFLVPHQLYLRLTEAFIVPEDMVFIESDQVFAFFINSH